MRKHIQSARSQMLRRIPVSLLTLLLISAVASHSGSAQNPPAYPNWPGPGQLFVGTCYQPIDRSPEEIDHDIAIMKRAGFNVVRMGEIGRAHV